MPISYYLIPVVTALIGWGTNVIAVKMLFHPRYPVNLGFMKLQGLVPKRRGALAKSLSTLVDRELLSVPELVAEFNRIDIEAHVEGLLDAKLDNYIAGLKESIPMVGMFLNAEYEAILKSKAKEELLKMVPELKEYIAQTLHDDLDIQAFVEEKVKNFSVRKMEEITMHVATKELKTIEVLGGVLGLVIGLLQVLLMLYLA